MYNKKIPLDLNCGFRIALEVFGGKWKPYIIYELIDKSLRPSEIARLLPEANERVINQQLKELMLYGVVEKKIINTQNKHSEYSLTELGRSLLPIIDAMRDWGNDFKSTLQQVIDKTAK
ncbi:MAG: helix-turn-helix transcriptional regulator [Bacteroidales bacterium]|nr:helix-turn-helix transcriptional regulator [Bacteroidales bacterium]